MDAVTCQAGSAECAAPPPPTEQVHKLGSGNHKTAFGAKPAENLAFPYERLGLKHNNPGRLLR
jgi:hypothetical protein